MITQTKAFHNTEITVLWSHMDANGHVNNGIYQSYFDEARMQALEKAGFSIAQMRSEQIGPVILEAHLTYHKPLSHPDSVRIETNFRDGSKFKGKVVQSMYRISDGELVCRAEFLALFFDFKKKRPYALPDEFLNLFQNLES
ncbi:acyl-CoA thioester hydrolase, YbgC/YbaW family [Leptospira ryugenii]|uniref:Acyl-CoA thioester hydrolase, YbgC/YbaW family n=1 Tax=Leptospira ryugenii TaxID=1917863 RepID=A0A2P2E588_9LEPT|nr:thioesterase family protein [Leptospira ryugenii]GBF52024.1 acyl-CoA thioester hydrolase, YbgC/YbaW family [Leptospira ryugenii]